MADLPRCSGCGAPIAAGTQAGLCPVCLLRLGIGNPTDQTRLGSTESPDAATMIGTSQSDATVLATNVPTPSGSRSSSEPHLPDAIGPYRIVKALGEGGMGVVYLAEQTEPIRRTVALKVIKLGMDTRDVVARFEAERQALALMDHPNIARVIDAGATPDGRPFFVMEHVAGVPITDYCDAHRVPTRARIELVAQICGAMQHAHQKGIIHRDLKPSNVLVAEHDGTPVPKIIDFGIAKATQQSLTERTMFTEQGQFMGTPEYMSPEQTGLAGLDVDATTDIYSLGVLLYELLVGALPFEPAALRRAGYAEMQRIIREDEPPRPSTRVGTLGATATAVAERRDTDLGALRKQLAGDLDWITLKAMEKDRVRRYASASEFAADIRRYLNDEPVLASPPSAAYRAQKFVRRHRLVVTAAGLVLTAVVAGLIVSLAMYVRADRERRDADTARAAADVARADASAKAISEAQQRKVAEAATVAETQARVQADAQRDRAEVLRVEADEQRAAAQQRAYVANLTSADMNLQSSRAMEARRLLLLTEPLLRGWEWRHLYAATDTSLIALNSFGDFSRFPAIAASFAFSPDGSRVFWNTETTVHVWDRASFRLLESYGGFGAIIGMAPAGRWILVMPPQSSSGLTLQLIEPASRRVAATIGITASIDCAAISREGSVAFRDANGLYMWNLASSRAQLITDAKGVRCPRLSEDGRLLAAGGTQIQIWDVSSGTSQRVLPYSGHVVAFSPDGKRLASAADDHSIRIADLSTDAEPTVLTGNDVAVLALAFSSDGQRLASTSWDSSVRIWNLATRTAVARFLGQSVSYIHSTAFDPTGQHLFSSDNSGKVRVWDAGSAGELTALPTGDLRTTAIAFSSDSKLLVSAFQDGTLRLWDTAARAAPRTVRAHSASISSVAIDSSRGRIVSGSADKTVKVWEVSGSLALLTLAGHTDQIESVSISPSGHHVASASRDKTVRVWDMLTGETVSRLDVGDLANAVVFSNDGSRLFIGLGDKQFAETSGARQTLTMWDWRSRRQVASIDARDGGAVIAMALAPDGKRLIVLGNGFNRGYVWDSDLTRRLAILQGDQTATSVLKQVAFSPNGQRIATTSDDGTTRIWNAQTGESLLSLRHPDRGSGPVAFSPDGSRLATGSATAIYLWETRSSYEPRALALVPSRSLAEDPVLSSDAVTRITRDSTLPLDVRDAAVRLVEAQGDDPAHLNTKSFDLVKSPGENRSAYELAVRRAATAVRLAPWNAAYANTLALALYRAGRYQEALDTVYRASGLRARPNSNDTVVSVLARLRLGQLDAARADLLGLTREAAGTDALKVLVAEATALSANLARRH